VVAADAAGGDDHRLSVQLEGAYRRPRAWPAALDAARLEDGSGHPVDGAVGGGQRVDTVPEAEFQATVLGRRSHPFLERLDDPRPGSPGDVEPWHGVPVTGGEVAAAFGQPTTGTTW